MGSDVEQHEQQQEKDGSGSAVVEALAEMKVEIMELRRALEQRGALDEVPLTLTEAAKRLHVSFSRTLAPAIEAKQIVTVPWGNEVRITPDEIARVLREGFGGKARRAKKARRATRTTASIAQARSYSYEAALQSAGS